MFVVQNPRIMRKNITYIKRLGRQADEPLGKFRDFVCVRTARFCSDRPFFYFKFLLYAEPRKFKPTFPIREH